MLIGETTAESIKKAIGSAFPGSEVKEMEVKGRNLAEGIPRGFTVSSNEILEALTDPLNQIVSAGDGDAFVSARVRDQERALALLNLPPGQVVAIEDSPQGLAAATGAGITTLVTRSLASAEHGIESFAGAAALVSHLGEANQPALVLHGPPCLDGPISLGYLHQLLQP